MEEKDTLTSQDLSVLIRLIGEVRVSPLDQSAVSTVAVLSALAQKLSRMAKGLEEVSSSDVE